MHIIVIGAGEVGSHIVETLVLGGHDVVLIERDIERAANARDRLDALVLDGNGASPDVLAAAGIERAALLVAVTDNDDSNLIACLAGRSMTSRDKLRTVARVRDRSYFRGRSAVMHGALGIDLVISPDRTTANDIADALELPGAVTVEPFAGGKLVVGEVIVHADSPALGRSFLELRETGHVVAGFTRGGKLSIAYDESTVEAGDHLFVLSPRSEAARTVGYLAGTTNKVKRVMIVGATEIGMHLSRRLARTGRAVTLVESQRARAVAAAERSDDVLVLRAEGTDRETLVEEGIADIDAFVACTEDDGDNLLAALTARQLGARTAFALVSRSDYLALVDAMSVDAAFSPRMHTADAILRFVRRGEVERLHQFVGGAEMIELRAAPECAATRGALRELKLPRDCIVSAIVRGDDIVYPRGNDTVEVGDRVVVLAQPGAIASVERLFQA
ncbi:MAG: Trk system potassium transporter TrkA [Thermoleophilia bacterium]|nr:Trk system potassium transporter TrkA [Thermoleophilia bacterium]